MNRRTGWNYLLALVVVAALAGGTWAQETTPAKPTTPASKKRTFSDSDLDKYKGKGNISQSTIGKPKPQAPAAGADGKTPVDSWFKPNLDLDGRKHKSDTLAAYQECEKQKAAASAQLNRWTELHNQLQKASKSSDKKKIEGQVKTLEKEMTPTLDAVRTAEERLDACLKRAYEAGVLSSSAAQDYKRAADARAAAVKDEGR